MKITSTQRFGKVMFDLEMAMDVPAEMQPLLESALESLKTDIAAKAKKQFAADVGLKAAQYETEMMDDPIEAEKVFKPLFEAKNIVASNFRPWVPGVNGTVLAAFERLVAKLASTPDYCEGKTASEILAGLA